jgi:hypothetical protein
MTRLLIPLAAALLALHLGEDTFSPGSGGFAGLLADWFQPTAFLGCGLTVLSRGDSRADSWSHLPLRGIARRVWGM